MTPKLTEDELEEQQRTKLLAGSLWREFRDNRAGLAADEERVLFEDLIYERVWNRLLEMARATTAQEGMVLVPREPKEEWLRAFIMCPADEVLLGWEATLKVISKLAAAPKADGEGKT